jgi:hypothetical protein
MNKKDEEIQRKLQELESVVLKEASQREAVNPPALSDKSSDLVHTKTNPPAQQATSSSVGNDLCYFAGIGLLITGLIMVFNHARIGTGFLTAFGAGGFGLVLVPLVIGIGWLIYDAKNKWAWLLTVGTCIAIVFSVLSSLVLNFPQMTLLGMIMMLAPFAAGGALLLKGIGGPKGIEDKLKNKS